MLSYDSDVPPWCFRSRWSPDGLQPQMNICQYQAGYPTDLVSVCKRLWSPGTVLCCQMWIEAISFGRMKWLLEGTDLRNIYLKFKWFSSTANFSVVSLPISFSIAKIYSQVVQFLKPSFALQCAKLHGWRYFYGNKVYLGLGMIQLLKGHLFH